MKHNRHLWKVLILLLAVSALLLCATSCDGVDGSDSSDSSDSSIPADTLGSAENTAAETTPDLSTLEPAALWEAFCDVTDRQTHHQIHIVGSVTVLNDKMEGMDYGLSLHLSHDGELTGITMTDLNGGHAREMTYADGILYWRENGEQLRISLNENRVATLIAAINHSFSTGVSPADVESYSNFITELPTADTLFSSITAASDGSAYTVTLAEPVVGEGEKSFFANTLQEMTVTAAASHDGRLQGVSLQGIWSSEDTHSYISILPLLADTLGMESGTSGHYKRMEWSLRMDFTYEDETVAPPVPTAEDIHAVCLFPSLDEAMAFDRFLDERRVRILNEPDVFGRQQIMDAEDNVTDEEQYLLINAVNVYLDELYGIAHSFGGIAFPAHLDKDANGVLSMLGTVPDHPDFRVAEYHDLDKRADFEARFPFLKEKISLENSDAHYLWDINEPEAFFTLDVEPYSSDNARRAIFRLLTGEDAK